jgi:hypothetical protein
MLDFYIKDSCERSMLETPGCTRTIDERVTVAGNLTVVAMSGSDN